MASLLNTMQRLSAIVGGRRKQFGGARRRESTRKLPGPRLRGLESLEQRTLLSVASLTIGQGAAVSTAAASDATPSSRLMVRFDDAVELASADRIAADLGATLVRTLPSIHGAVIQVNTAGQDFQGAMSAAVASWSAYPGVRYAEADGLVHIDNTVPNDPLFSQLWGMQNTGQTGGVAGADISAPETWDIFRGSSSVVVASIDTGVDYTHPDLAANMWVNPGEIPNNGIDDDRDGYIDDVHGINAITGSGDPMDDHGHGTHTSGTMGAVGNNGVGVVGVNWNVKIMGLKFLSAGGWGMISDAVTCVDYTTKMKTQFGVNIVASNNSWGGGGYSQAMYDAIKASNDAGIMFVAAAGNGGYDNDLFPSYPASYNLPGIIAVAATDDTDTLAYFSQYGRTSVDLGAPGVGILSTVPPNLYGVSYEAWDGTSMATPHVTGAVALGMAYEPSATLDYIKQQILNSVDVVPSLVNRTVTGGRLNLYNYITSFNQAPVLSPLAAMSLRPIEQEDATNFGTRITTILRSGGADPISDPNANAKEGIAITAVNTSHGSWQYTTNNGVLWTAMLKPSNASARLLAADTATRIRFVPDAGYTGFINPAITFRAWDQAAGKNGGIGNATKNGGRTTFSTGTATASITVTPVNHAPVRNSSVHLSLGPINENDVTNTGSSIPYILASGGAPAVIDVDANPMQGIAVTGVDSTHGSWEYSLDGGSTWASVGAPTVSSALLLAADADTRLRFIPDTDFYGTVAAGVGFRAWDQTAGDSGDIADTRDFGGKTAFSADISAASITVKWINKAPQLDSTAPLQMTPINEDDTSNPGTLIAGILTNLGASPITDPDAGTSPGVGIAVIQAGTTDGAWQYTTNGTDWLPIGSPSGSAAMLLAADATTRLRLVPNQDFNGTVDAGIAFLAWDQSSGTNGGTAVATVTGGATAFSAGLPGTIGIVVDPVNDAPTFAIGLDQQVPEDSGPQLVPGWATNISPGPPDESAQIVELVIVSNDNPGLFADQPAIDAQTGDLTYTPAPNASGKATVTVRAQDDGGTENGGVDTSTAQTFTITVQWVNGVPLFVKGWDQYVNENSPQQNIPRWATNISCGAGESGQTVQFFVDVDPSQAAMFAEVPTINPSGTLTYRLAPNAVGTAAIIVSLHDNAGTANGGHDTSDPQTFNIVVRPVNEKPTALAQQLTTDASQSASFTLTGDGGDPEVEQVLTFAITSSPKHGKITLNPATGDVVYVPDAGAIGLDSFAFTVQDDNRAGTPYYLTSDPATVQIWVNPVVQVPTGAGTNSLILHLVKGMLQLDLTAGRGTQKLFNQPLSSVHKLTIVGTAAQPDLLTVDFAAGGKFGIPEGVVFDGASAGGIDMLAVRGTSGTDLFSVDTDHLVANGLSVAFQPTFGQVRLDGGAGNDSYAIAAIEVPVRISDSSGTDTLDFSQCASGITVDLNQSAGQAQQVLAGRSALSLAGTFENVVGSNFDDVIKGNSAANHIWGGNGNDTLYGGAGNDILYGGEGNDVLYADTGIDILLGGDGDDVLNAGMAKTARSILIGGTGRDILNGSSGETILIGGTTTYDNQDAALAAILTEWGSSRDFNTRVTRLRNGITVRLNGQSTLLQLKLNTTVFDDLAQDRLIGGLGKDWFLGFTADSIEGSGPGDVTDVPGSARSAK